MLFVCRALLITKQVQHIRECRETAVQNVRALVKVQIVRYCMVDHLEVVWLSPEELWCLFMT
jgi:hypothetical protein